MSLFESKTFKGVTLSMGWVFKIFFKVTRQLCLNKILHEIHVNKTVNLELF